MALRPGDCNLKCCLSQILGRDCHVNAPFHHYESGLSSESLKVPYLVNDGKVPNELHGNGTKKDPESVSFHEPSISTSYLTEDLCCSCENRVSTFSECLKGSPIVYGASVVPNTLSDQQMYFCDVPSFSKLETLVDFMKVRRVGLLSPYLYLWSAHSTFVWHLDRTCLQSKTDMDRVWFLIPCKFVEKFNSLVINSLNLNLCEATCLNLLGYDCPLVKTSHRLHKIMVFMVLEDSSECAILGHSSCILGPNIGKAVHLAREVRIPNQSFLKHETLTQSALAAVHAEVHGSSNFKETVSTPKTIQTFESSQSSSYGSHNYCLCHDEIIDPHEVKIEEMDLNTICVKQEGEKEEKNMMEKTAEGSMEQDSSGTKEREGDAYDHVLCMCKGALLLQCPECDQTYKGGTDRLKELLQHAKKCHNTYGESLLDSIREKYPIGVCRHLGTQKKRKRCRMFSKKFFSE